MKTSIVLLLPFCFLGCVDEKRKEFDVAMLDVCEMQMQMISKATKAYFNKVGRLPYELLDLIDPPDGLPQNEWQGPYLEGGIVPKDPWGKPFWFEAKGDNPHNIVIKISSYGPDGKPDTSDDIVRKY